MLLGVLVEYKTSAPLEVAAASEIRRVRRQQDRTRVKRKRTDSDDEVQELKGSSCPMLRESGERQSARGSRWSSFHTVSHDQRGGGSGHEMTSSVNDTIRPSQHWRPTQCPPVRLSLQHCTADWSIVQAERLFYFLFLDPAALT